MENAYIPFPSKVLDVIKHTDIEYTFRLEFTGDVKPGQFFEVSIPKFGEAPISVSGIGDHYVDLTIRRVGVVTNEVFEKYKAYRTSALYAMYAEALLAVFLRAFKSQSNALFTAVLGDEA